MNATQLEFQEILKGVPTLPQDEIAANNPTVWIVSLGLSETIADIDDAILWVRFWREWTKYAAIPVDEDDAGGVLDFSSYTKAAWRTVQEINKPLSKKGQK